MDVGKAVREAKAGKQEYRTDRGANVHVSLGKKSFDERALLENYAALVDEIVRAKPAAAKGRYIRQVTLATTMGPGIKIDPSRTRGIVEEEGAEAVEAGFGYSARLTRRPVRRRQPAARKAEVRPRWRRRTCTRPPGPPSRGLRHFRRN